MIVSELGPSGAAKQLGLLAAALPRERYRVEVSVLGPASSPATEALRATGVPVHALPMRHFVDITGLRRLRQVAADIEPAVVHAWGPREVRASRVISGTAFGAVPLVVSAASMPAGSVPRWFTTRLLRRADRVVAATWTDGERYRRLGVPAERLCRVAPAVACPPPHPDPVAFRRSLGLPPYARLIMAAGQLDATSGLKAAVWAFDMLRYEAPDLHLVIFGDGPDRWRLEEYGRALAFDDFRVTFAGHRADLPAVLGLAEVVWVTHERGGVNVALEAMAAGRPVVAWRTPEIAEVIADGETGLLVQTGERPQIAARSHTLLADTAMAAKIGAAGRVRAASRYPIERMAEQYARLYAELAGGVRT
jgi:glycosyltransferase involved in cell wall biosynthesis